MAFIAPCVFIPKSVTDETLAVAPTPGKRLLEPFKSASGSSAIYILEDCEIDNEFEVHRHEADLWICLEGEVEFEVGGELVEPWAKKLPDGKEDTREIKAKPGSAQGTIKYTLHAGDVLLVPAGQPHTHRTKTHARLYVTKIPQKEISLADVPGWEA